MQKSERNNKLLHTIIILKSMMDNEASNENKIFKNIEQKVHVERNVSK